MILAAVEVIIEQPPTPWWVPWISAAAAIALFVLGFVVAPLGKAREALFLEQRHARRLLRAAARIAMNNLAGLKYDAFQNRHRNNIHNATIDFQKTVEEHGPTASATDESSAEVLQVLITKMWEEKSEQAYLDCRAALYPAYLDLMHPWLRWRRRRSALLERQPKIQKDDFATATRAPVDAPGSDVSH